MTAGHQTGTDARVAREPLVTVAIPTHNRAQSLRTAVESVLAQTFGDFELLILDDASSDDTPAVVTSYHDPRLRYVRHPANIGMTANWNRGFELGRGRYVAPLHDDDRWSARFLERMVQGLERCPEAGLVYCAPDLMHGLMTEDRILSPTEALDRLRRRNEVPTVGVLVRRSALLEVGGFRDRWRYSMDWEAWLKIVARWPVAYVAERLAFQGHDAADRFSSRLDETPLVIARDKLGMLQETIPALPLPEEQRRRLLDDARRSLAQAQLVTAWDCAVSGDRPRARLEARFAFRIDRKVLRRSPHLVGAAYLGSLLPPTVLRLLNRIRRAARPIFRRD